MATEGRPLTPELRAAVKAAAIVAANAAIRTTLLTMGVDISSPEAVKEMQEDMAYLRNMRTEGSERATFYWTAVIGVGSAVIASILTLFIRQTFFPGMPHH